MMMTMMMITIIMTMMVLLWRSRGFFFITFLKRFLASCSALFSVNFSLVTFMSPVMRSMNSCSMMYSAPDSTETDGVKNQKNLVTWRRSGDWGERR